MTKASDLEQAIEVRDAVRQIDLFLKGYYDAEGGWKGEVKLSFGGYFCAVDAVVYSDLLEVIAKQRNAHTAQLLELGVDMEEPK